MNVLKYSLYAVFIIGLLAFLGASGGVNPVVFFDLPSALFVLAGPIVLLRSVKSPMGLPDAFKAVLGTACDPAQTALAATFFMTMTKYLLLSGLIGWVISMAVALIEVNSPAFVGSLWVAVLPVLYAVFLAVLVTLPLWWLSKRPVPGEKR